MRSMRIENVSYEMSFMRSSLQVPSMKLPQRRALKYSDLLARNSEFTWTLLEKVLLSSKVNLKMLLLLLVLVGIDSVLVWLNLSLAVSSFSFQCFWSYL